jgi:hypothetical protein
MEGFVVGPGVVVVGAAVPALGAGAVIAGVLFVVVVFAVLEPLLAAKTR